MFEFNTLKEIPSYLNKSIFNDSFLNYIENGKYRSISSQKFVENIYKLSHAFSKVGVKKGTTVAIVQTHRHFG